MDTSRKSERAGKRQIRSVQEKLRVIEEANPPGASVAAVALRHGENTNLVYWLARAHRRGLPSSANTAIGSAARVAKHSALGAYLNHDL